MAGGVISAVALMIYLSGLLSLISDSDTMQYVSNFEYRNALQLQNSRYR